MHTPSLFCLSLPLSQVTLFLALFFMLPICDAFKFYSIRSLSFCHGLPIDIQYCCLDLKVWAFHKNGILAVPNVASVCSNLVSLLKLCTQPNKMMSKDLWTKWNCYLLSCIAEFTGCIIIQWFKTVAIRMYCYVAGFIWKRQSLSLVVSWSCVID